jgi:PPOX class probable F420-dependent enzyme
VPQSPIPERFHDILQSTTLGHLATIDEHGRPMVNPVWFLWDGEHVLMSVKPGTKKFASLQRDPHLAISFVDLAKPTHYFEIRGEVISFELYENLDFVNLLARKYTGADFTRGHVGEHRYKLTIQVNSWTGQ